MTDHPSPAGRMRSVKSALASALARALARGLANGRGRPLSALLASILICLGAQASAGENLPVARHAAKAIGEIYHLDRQGEETALSLRSIDWQPTEASLLLMPDDGDWFALLESTPDAGRLALATVTDAGSRRVALGANPLHDLARSHRTGGAADPITERWFDNTVAWLVDNEMPFAPDGRSLRVVLADLNGVSGDSPDRITRRWFATRARHVDLSAPWACDGELLAACLENADLVVLGPGNTLTGAGDAVGNVLANKDSLLGTLDRADALGIPVLYLHEDNRLATDAAAAPPGLDALQTLGLSASRNVAALGVVRGDAPYPSLVTSAPVTPVLAAAVPGVTGTPVTGPGATGAR